MIYKDMFDRLPERYRKTNTEKIYKVLFSSYNEINSSIEGIKDSRDIDKAFGETLDKIGWNVGVFRKNEDDDLFRMLIKIGIVVNLSKGDIPTLNQVSKTLLGDNFIGIRETWNIGEYDKEPAGIVLEMIPGLQGMPNEIIVRATAGGVGVTFILAYKQVTPEIFIGTTTIDGDTTTIIPFIQKEANLETKVSVAFRGNGSEEATIYPNHLYNLDGKGDIYIAIGHDLGFENTTIYPK